jgi:flavin reductase (DIM6/NTAB) family NADH-FMN oxidoreductase RutF
LSDGLDARELRNAFGCFVTGITVVTALDGGQAVGITANSFASLSLDPPLVLWSVGRQSATFDIFRRTDAFVVSVLGLDGAPIASRFAMKGAHYVDEIETVPTELGPPTFGEALAVFECETHARHEGGDHVILVGRVKRFTHVPDPERKGPRPLAYYRGRYGTVADFTG